MVLWEKADIRFLPLFVLVERTENSFLGGLKNILLVFFNHCTDAYYLTCYTSKSISLFLGEERNISKALETEAEGMK